MLHITITSYDEAHDTFKGDVHDNVCDAAYQINIPACLMPYIAASATNECEDLPFDMVGKSFELTSLLVDG